MILDKGMCFIYHVNDSAEAGDMPKPQMTLFCRSYYGELNFDTTSKGNEFQEDVQINARIRILQNREISTHDVVMLSTNGQNAFKIIRAFHGIDKDNGQLVSDLSLQEVQQVYDVTTIP